MKTIFRLVLLIALIWLLYDLFAPHRGDLRAFNAQEVGRLETQMWRSYYANDQLSLFNQAATTLREQYGTPRTRSYIIALEAARAAFTFKGGHSRSDYERALPQIESFYKSIRESSNIAFDPNRAAKLELEWWIIHRERRKHGEQAPEDLARALAELQSEVYRIPAERAAKHAELRAEAMLLRDDKEEKGTVSEEDWNRIEQLLRASWQSLSDEVRK